MAEEPQFHIVQTKSNVSVPLLFLSKWLRTSPLSSVHCTLGCPGGFPTGCRRRVLVPPSPPASPGERGSSDVCKYLSGLCLEYLCPFIVFLLLGSLR